MAADNSGHRPRIAIDAPSGKIVMVTTDLSADGRLGMYRCPLTGINPQCIHIDLSSAGAPARSGGLPALAIDAANRRLLVATADESNDGRLALFRCGFDGASCDYLHLSELSGTSSPYSGLSPSLMIEPGTGRYFIATCNNGPLEKPALFFLR